MPPEGHRIAPAGRGRPPLAAVLGTAVFVLAVPGTAVVVGPWLLSGWKLREPLLDTVWTRWLGLLLLAAALPLFADFVLRFVREGHGTPAPIAPTRFLVRGGPFRWTRNPGYLGVLGLLAGQGLVFASPAVLVYAAVIGLAFHAFVVAYEEPALRRRFGAEYETYCRAVPRWLPRPPRR